MKLVGNTRNPTTDSQTERKDEEMEIEIRDTKLSDLQIERIIEKHTNQHFDDCSVCGGAQLGNEMSNVDDNDLDNYDLICDDCVEREE